jgi:hypothetical protein
VQKGWIALWQEQASRIGKQQMHMLTILYNELIIQKALQNLKMCNWISSARWAEKWVYSGIGARQ